MSEGRNLVEPSKHGNSSISFLNFDLLAWSESWLATKSRVEFVLVLQTYSVSFVFGVKKNPPHMKA